MERVNPLLGNIIVLVHLDILELIVRQIIIVNLVLALMVPLVFRMQIPSYALVLLATLEHFVMKVQIKISN